MPRSTRYGFIAAGQLPGTLQRSCREAQAMFLQAYQDATQAYGAGDEALRAAYSILKKKFEKRGDRWVAKTTESAA